MAGEKVLIVEDSLEILSFLADDVLPYHGYKVATAITGQEGRDKLSSEEPDLLLLDLELPVIQGGMVAKMESAFQALKQDVPRVHILQWQGANTLHEVVQQQSKAGTTVTK